MEMTDELRELLRERYNVFYNENQGAWMRSEGKWEKKTYDLGVVTKLITGENVMTKGNSYVKYSGDKIDGRICVCGCPFCIYLYPMFHVQTHTCFMVGSECIKKAGHENFVHDLKCAAKNGICLDCQQPLVFQGKRKNCNKKENRSACIECDTKKKLIIEEERQVRYEKRREEELLIEKERQIALRIANEIRRRDEQERLSRIQKVFLNITFKEKDKYKIYNTRWDCEAKLWYWEGDINDLPDPLVALKRC
jgi:hypothetical protein